MDARVLDRYARMPSRIRMWLKSSGRPAGDFKAEQTTEEHVVGAITGVGEGRVKEERSKEGQPPAEEGK